MTLDGICDHTAVTPDESLHDHYTDLLRTAGVLLYGRKTFQLMEYWRSVAESPTGNKSLDDFARVMDAVPKVVFSRTLTETDWPGARIATRDLRTEVEDLKQQDGLAVYAGSPGLISSLTELNLIDEYQICLHPVIAGGGLPLFRDLTRNKNLNLVQTKQLASGALILYYSASTLIS